MTDDLPIVLLHGSATGSYSCIGKPGLVWNWQIVLQKTVEDRRRA